MTKIRNRNLSLILVLAMLMTMFVGIGTASAATYSYSGSGIVSEGSCNLGAVVIELPTLNIGTHELVVKLPKDFVAGAVYFSDLTETAFAMLANGSVALNGTVKTHGQELVVNSNMFVFSVTNTAVLSGQKYSLSFPSATVPSGADKAVFTLIKKSGSFTDGVVNVGEVTSGAVDVLITDPPTITGVGGTTVINVREDIAGALKKEGDTLKIKLPRGFSWTGATMHTFPPAAGLGLPNTWNSYISTEFSFDYTDDSILKITRSATAGASVDGKYDAAKANIFSIVAAFDVDENIADFGEVNLTLSGKSNLRNSSVLMGTYKDYGYTIKVEDEDSELVAGLREQEISEVTLKENIKNSLINGRTIWAQLPDGVEWTGPNSGTKKNASPTTNDLTFTTDAGIGGFVIDFVIQKDDWSLAKGVLNSIDPSKAQKTKFKNVEVDVAADFTGPITIELYGSAGVNEKVTVGKVIAPVSGAAETNDVIIGLQDQKAGDITITEAKAGAISSRDKLRTGITHFELVAPRGVSWAKLPKVEVAEGDLVLTEARRVWEGERHVLQLGVKNQSSKASTIKITDVYYTVDRTVPEGDLEIGISGNAVDQTLDDQFINRDAVATIVAATVVTPAPGETIGNGEFRIGSNIYYAGGVAKVMEVAPYIKAGRTYVPMRVLGEDILGAEVVWDDAARTVTLTKGDTIVVFTIGSVTYTVNGESMTNEVEPEIVDGRTMLPARAVAEAFGAVVGWDPATRTVLIQK